MHYFPYRYYYPYRYNFGYYPIPYRSYINSQIARTNQSIYNSGYMEDVFQNTNIMQSRAGIGCTVPEPEMVGLSTCPQNPVIESLD